MHKYDVILHNGAMSNESIFEGKNILRSNVVLSNCYCGIGTTISEGTILSRAKIGKYVSIGQNVRNSLGMHPSKIFVSTYPGFYLPSDERISFTNLLKFDKHTYVDNEKKVLNEIGHDVWIGNNVTIFDGVRIGNGAIIGTGAIVTKDVEPYDIVAGIPAKKIRSRFSDEQIEFLMSFCWWDRDLKWLRDNSDFFLDIDTLMTSFKNA